MTEDDLFTHYTSMAVSFGRVEAERDAAIQSGEAAAAALQVAQASIETMQYEIVRLRKQEHESNDAQRGLYDGLQSLVEEAEKYRNNIRPATRGRKLFHLDAALHTRILIVKSLLDSFRPF